MCTIPAWIRPSPSRVSSHEGSMTTLRDHGTTPVEMLTCPLRPERLYIPRDLALRDMRTANARDPETGAGDGNGSWIGLSLAMIVLDSLSGRVDEPVRRRWMRLLAGHGVSELDASIIYALRCSLLHGYGLPKPTEAFGRDLVLSNAMNAYALETDHEGSARLSVPAFCGRLVERIASEAVDGWDNSLIGIRTVPPSG
jgi:hypothetical protein